MNTYMSTREVATYLRLGERKIYELVAEKRIPFARITGKILFARKQIDQWVASQSLMPEGFIMPAPPVIAGSHDPLLDWAVRESECDLALLACGSVGGLDKLSEGNAIAAATHVLDPATGDYNVAALKDAATYGDTVLITWASRQQGLAMARSKTVSLMDALAQGNRMAMRQQGAGARILLTHLARQAGVDSLPEGGPIARTESDLAAMIAEGHADSGICIEATARRYKLNFLPLVWERFDLAMRRHNYFEPPIQRLLAFARTPTFQEKAKELGGYDISENGKICFNS
jgi:excisionase family DNA binding protein